MFIDLRIYYVIIEVLIEGQLYRKIFPCLLHMIFFKAQIEYYALYIYFTEKD